jgi:DNA polymerase-3 subunit delta'
LQEDGVPAAAAAGLLRAAGGPPQDALLLHRAGLDAQAWARWPKALARGDAGLLADWGPAEVVQSLQKLCHDLVAVQSGAQPRFFAAGDLPPPGDPAALSGWWRDLAATARTVEHPFNAGLLLEDLVTRARSALNSRTPA